MELKISKIIKSISQKIAAGKGDYYYNQLHDRVVDLIEPYEKNPNFSHKPSFYVNIRDRIMNRFQLEENEANDAMVDIVEEEFPELANYLELN